MARAHCKFTGKVILRDEHEARRTLRKLRGEYDQLVRKGTKLVRRAEDRYYECEHADHYHLTSMKLVDYQRRAER